MKKIIPILVYDQSKNKTVFVGKFHRESKTFIKKVNPKIHFHRLLNAYGIQDAVLSQLDKLDCQKVSIHEKNRRLISHFPMWLNYAVKKNFGHGLQHFLPIQQMDIIDENQDEFSFSKEVNGEQTRRTV